MPDMIHHSGPSSGHSNGSRPSGTNSGQPFTLTRHKKVEIPATSILSHPQNATRREPSDLGIPYPSGIIDVLILIDRRDEDKINVTNFCVFGFNRFRRKGVKCFTQGGKSYL